MVVPVERATSSHKVKKYVGNDLNLSILSNKKTLIVAGNNCKLELSENSGHVKVIGDYCDITILKGNGNVEYVGNYGKIRLGLDISEDAVSYIGNGGEISTDKYSCAESQTEHKQSQSSVRCGSKTDPKRNHIDISNVSKIRYRTTVMPNNVHIAVPSVRISTRFKTENTNT